MAKLPRANFASSPFASSRRNLFVELLYESLGQLKSVTAVILARRLAL
ncbi:MAG: hypothetical protein U0903_05110 [Planctomycetales bacterium]